MHLNNIMNFVLLLTLMVHSNGIHSVINNVTEHNLTMNHESYKITNRFMATSSGISGPSPKSIANNTDAFGNTEMRNKPGHSLYITYIFVFVAVPSFMIVFFFCFLTYICCGDSKFCDIKQDINHYTFGICEL